LDTGAWETVSPAPLITILGSQSLALKVVVCASAGHANSAEHSKPSAAIQRIKNDP
jgi:hypothetical protein